MQIALYKGPVNLLEDPGKFIGHWAIRFRTWSKYSHAELVIDGVCYSSSSRDKGVRGKVIDLDNGHWDVIELRDGLDEAAALQWFLDREEWLYDWRGIVRYVLPFVHHRRDQAFCYEAVDAALGGTDSHKVDAEDLIERYAK